MFSMLKILRVCEWLNTATKNMPKLLLKDYPLSKRTTISKKSCIQKHQPNIHFTLNLETFFNNANR